MAGYFDKTILQRALFEGLTGFWDFNYSQVPQRARDLVNDTLGTSGSSVPSTIVAPHLGKGVSFDGSDDYIDTGVNVTNVGQPPGTLSLWIRPGSSGGVIVSSNASDAERPIQLWASTLRLVCDCRNYTDASWDTNLAVGRLDHRAVTWAEGNFPTLAFYLDGTPDGTGAGGQTTTGTNSLHLGIRSDLVAQWDGDMFHVRYWTRQLSAAEIQEVYQLDRQQLYGRRVFAVPGEPPGLTASGTTTSRVDTLGDVTVTAPTLPASGTTTSRVDTQGDITVTAPGLPAAGATTSRVDTQGDIDVTPPALGAAGSSTSRVDTLGDIDVTFPSIAATGSTTSRVDTLGDVSVQPPSGAAVGRTTSRVDTLGDILAPVVAIGVTTSRVDTLGDILPPVAALGATTSRVDTIGDIPTGDFQINPCRIAVAPTESRSATAKTENRTIESEC